MTVEAGQDDDDTANDTATLTHTAEHGGDYGSVSIATLPVTVTDDDEA